MSSFSKTFGASALALVSFLPTTAARAGENNCDLRNDRVALTVLPPGAGSTEPLPEGVDVALRPGETRYIVTEADGSKSEFYTMDEKAAAQQEGGAPANNTHLALRVDNEGNAFCSAFAGKTIRTADGHVIHTSNSLIGLNPGATLEIQATMFIDHETDLPVCVKVVAAQGEEINLANNEICTDVIPVTLTLDEYFRLIFQDGFENGTTNRWSTTVGENVVGAVRTDEGKMHFYHFSLNSGEEAPEAAMA
jgi:hypothetical protein